MTDTDFIKLLKKNGYELRSNKDLEAILSAMNEAFDAGYGLSVQHHMDSVK